MTLNINDITIRPETRNDYQKIAYLILKAFPDEEVNPLINALRESENYVTELALVAEYEGDIIAYVLFTKTPFEFDNDKSIGDKLNNT